MISDFERILGDVERKSEQGEKVLTKFLSLDEQNIAYGLQRQYEIGLFGGFNNAERKRAVINARNPKISEFHIIAYQIIYPSRLNINHRFILGTLMSLGLKRNNIGDIIVTDDEAYFLVCSEVSPVIEQEFTKINETPIKLKKISYERLEMLDQTKAKQINLIVPSLRLDVIIANGFKLSRKDASNYIISGLAFVNNREITKPDFEVGLNQIVSLRHYGRLKIVEVGKITKKERIVITIELYQ